MLIHCLYPFIPLGKALENSSAGEKTGTLYQVLGLRTKPGQSLIPFAHLTQDANF